MTTNTLLNAELLATIFAALMAISILVYAIADGYDLGTGMLLPLDNEDQRDIMIASIGPFWDANETWLVLAIGLLLIAFPEAHSHIFYHLYLPTTAMLAGLILRGVSFDFRAKTSVSQKNLWDKAFKAGSLITSFSQGFMLGQYVMGFSAGGLAIGFSILSGIGVSAAYCLIGAAWLIYKTEGKLQVQAWNWLQYSLIIALIGILLVCLTNLAINPGIFKRWFEWPWGLFLLSIPLVCIGCFICLAILSRQQKMFYSQNNRRAVKDMIPLLLTISIFILAFSGLVISFYPYIIPGELTIWQAASAPESLSFLLIGSVIVIPTIGAYTAYSYWVFRGKGGTLSYELQ